MKKLAALLVGTLVAVTGLIVASSVMAAGGATIYDSTESPLPGNLVSQPFQAQQTNEFGDRISFAGSARNLVSVTVTMSSWGCEFGHWAYATCVTTPGATFDVPITLNIYNAGSGGTPGSLITTKTETFAIPYRPSTDSDNCTGGAWYETSSGSCFNGKAANITFTFDGTVVLPDSIVYGISYNTSNYGPNPIGPAACSATSQGCPYDSLNVAFNTDSGTSVGTDVNPDGVFWNTETAGYYADGGTGGVNSFREDTGWTGYVPAVKFTAVGIAANANDCKKGGWANLTRADGSYFKNQGDCVSYTNNGK